MTTILSQSLILALIITSPSVRHRISAMRAVALRIPIICDLAAAAGAAAVFALVATAVAGHHASAFGAEGGVGGYCWPEGQGFLRILFGWAENRWGACFRYSELG